MSLKRLRHHTFTTIAGGVNWIIDNIFLRPAYVCPFASQCNKGNRFNSICFSGELFSHLCGDWRRFAIADRRK